jgi:hypothetical protein
MRKIELRIKYLKGKKSVIENISFDYNQAKSLQEKNTDGGKRSLEEYARLEIIKEGKYGDIPLLGFHKVHTIRELVEHNKNKSFIFIGGGYFPFNSTAFSGYELDHYFAENEGIVRFGDTNTLDIYSSFKDYKTLDDGNLIVVLI